MSIEQYYEQKFKDITITLVDYDNGNTPESMAAFVLCEGLNKAMMKDKGCTVLDLGNFLYRKYGLYLQTTPEYHKKDCPKNSLAFYISKRDMTRMPHIQDAIVKLQNKNNPDEPLSHWESALYSLGKAKLYTPPKRRMK